MGSLRIPARRDEACPLCESANQLGDLARDIYIWRVVEDGVNRSHLWYECRRCGHRWPFVSGKDEAPAPVGGSADS